MIDTDFDLLCDGANPAEAKCLRKILAEWCSGDENSFPVQLALLTKAQWRAVARLPHVVKDCQKELEKAQTSHRALLSEQFNSAMEDACRLASDSKKLLDAVQADHRRQIAVQSKSTVEAMEGSLKKLETRLEVYNGVLESIATKICTKARELESSSQEIHKQLVQGAETWNQAKVDFDAARQRMSEEREKLRKRIAVQNWIYNFLFYLFCLAFGIVLGKFCL